jgi:hypothetical protein
VSYERYWGNIHEQSDKLQELLSSYWHQYSDFGNWQFWVVLASLVLPLVLLYFTVDRTRIFEVFFFGYTVHMLWAYIFLNASASERNKYYGFYFAGRISAALSILYKSSKEFLSVYNSFERCFFVWTGAS